MLGNVLHNLPVLRVRIAERLEVIALIDGIGDTASHLQSLLEEEVLGFLQGSVIHNQQVAVCLQIDFVHIQLTGYGFPSRFQPLGVLHLVHLIGAYINRNLKVPVLCLYARQREAACQQAKTHLQQKVSFHHHLFNYIER